MTKKEVILLPKITDIQKQKKNQSRFSIYLDGTYAFGVSEDVMIRHHKQLGIGQEIEQAFIEEVLTAEEVQKAFDSAVNLLSFRPRSEKELRTRLKQKEFEENWIDLAITKLKSYGFINDDSFARMLARDKQNIKKLGSRGIKEELRQKGIDKEIIEEVIDEVFDTEKELEQAIELCEKKFRTLGEKDPIQKRKQKVFQFLVRKGYSFEIANKAISSVLAS